MKKVIIVLFAVAMATATVPAFAMEHEHGDSHNAMDEQCAKECEMLLKNCALEVDSIQEHIKKLQVEITEKGANTYTLEELKTLNKKLKETKEVLRSLEKSGR
jgi:peptidoglycan hydrolase CwlO-like protein